MKFFYQLGFWCLNTNLSVFAKKYMIIIIYFENLFLCNASKIEMSKIKDVLKAKFDLSNRKPVFFNLKWQ